MEQERLKKVYILTLCIAMFNKLPDIAFPWWFKYIHCVIWISIFLYKVDGRLYKRGDYVLTLSLATIKRIFLTPYLVFFALAPVGWLSYIESTRFNMITRAVSSTLQFSLIVFSVTATAYIFRERLLKYTFHAMVLNYSIIIIIAIYKCGIIDFIQTGLVPFGTAATRLTDDLLSARILEVHDLTFAAGFFFIYFLVWYKKIKSHRMSYLLLSVMLLYLGYKRIELGALAVIVCFAIMIDVRRKRSIRVWNMVYSVSILLVMYLFLWVIDSGLLKELVDGYGINLMHREKTYIYMSRFFSMSPSYIGRGMAAAIRLNLAGIAEGVWMVMGHSEILFNYIDHGFWGFTFWIIYCCYIVTRQLQKKFGNDAAKIWMLFTAYAFITYMTDNTAGYFAFQISYMVVLFHVLYTAKKNPTIKHGWTAMREV